MSVTSCWGKPFISYCERWLSPASAWAAESLWLALRGLIGKAFYIFHTHTDQAYLWQDYKSYYGKDLSHE